MVGIPGSTIPVEPQIPWDQVDKDIRSALEAAWDKAEEYASTELEKWTDELMIRVDEDFLPWYFSYWQQQMLGLKAVWWWGWDRLWNEKPTMLVNVTERIQRAFASRVLKPEDARMRIERITHRTAGIYINEIANNVVQIQLHHVIPQDEWDRYIESISLAPQTTEEDHATRISLKTIIDAEGAGYIKMTSPPVVNTRPPIASIEAEVHATNTKIKGEAQIAKEAVTETMAAMQTAEWLAGKIGKRLAGPAVAAGILISDVLDHRDERAVKEPILRKNLEDFLVEMRTDLLKDPETGIMAVVDHIEGQLVTSIKE